MVMEEDMIDEKEQKGKKKSLSIGKKIAVLWKKTSVKQRIILVSIILFICLFIIPLLNRPKGVQEVTSLSSLKEVVDTSSLSTYETVYNGVITVKNKDNKKKIDYYATYEGTIKAGLDFKEIQYRNDEKNKEIVVYLPPVKVQKPSISIDSIDFIFENKRVKKQGLVAKAYKLCLKDAQKEAEKQQGIISLAEDNAKNLLEGLLKPFVEDFGEDYTIKFEKLEDLKK